jgi:hypothetical protein
VTNGVSKRQLSEVAERTRHFLTGAALLTGASGVIGSTQIWPQKSDRHDQEEEARKALRQKDQEVMEEIQGCYRVNGAEILNESPVSGPLERPGKGRIPYGPKTSGQKCGK